MKIIGSDLVRSPSRWSGTRCSTRGCWSPPSRAASGSTATGENAYDMTVTAGVAAIKGTYQGSCTLSDLKQHESLVMRLSGRGAPGHHRRDRATSHSPSGAGGTTRSPTRPTRSSAAWSAASASGCSRSVSKRMAGEFFGNVARRCSGRRDRPVGAALHRVAVGRPPSRPAGVFTAPAKARGARLAGRLPQGRRHRGRAGARGGRRRRHLRSAPVSLTGVGRRLDRPRPGRGRPAPEISARELLDLHLARIAERNPSSTRSSRSTRSARGRAPQRPTRRSRPAPRSARCTGCRSRSRTPTRSPAGGRRTARRCTPTTCPAGTT